MTPPRRLASLCELSAIASALRGLRRRNRCGACARATATAFRLSERPRHRERRWLDDPKAGRVGLVDPAFGLQRASLSIPEAIGEEKRLHPRDRERVEAKFPPSDQLLAPPASVSEKFRPGKPTAVARRRVINLVWPEKAEDWPAATKRAVWHSLENLDSVAT